jgi:hypothetical protein
VKVYSRTHLSDAFGEESKDLPAGAVDENAKVSLGGGERGGVGFDGLMSGAPVGRVSERVG